MTRLQLMRHYKLLLLLALLAGLLIAGAGDQPIVAYSLPDAGAAVSHGDAPVVLVHNVAGGARPSGTVPAVSPDISR